jgi:hypothetical protein
LQLKVYAFREESSSFCFEDGEEEVVLVEGDLFRVRNVGGRVGRISFTEGAGNLLSGSSSSSSDSLSLDSSPKNNRGIEFVEYRCGGGVIGPTISIDETIPLEWFSLVGGVDLTVLSPASNEVNASCCRLHCSAIVVAILLPLRNSSILLRLHSSAESK